MTVDAISTLVLSELERLADIQSMAIYGVLSDEGIESSPIPVQKFETQDLLRDESETLPRSDYVVYISDTGLSAIGRRTVAHRLASVTDRVLLVIAPLGAELPVPLIEVKRGLLLDSGSKGYRLLGTRR